MQPEVIQEYGPGGLAFVRLRSRGGTARVCLLGGTVTEYQPAGGEPVLWVSPNSRYAPAEAIRGGIPVCWPWFGQHPRHPEWPAHGFARKQMWRVTDPGGVSPDGETAWVELGLDGGEGGFAGWDGHFRLRLRVSVGAALDVALTTTNTGPHPFDLSAALHTYFAVSDIAQVTVHHLENTPFLSKAHHWERFVSSDPLRFTDRTDSVYLDTTAACEIQDSGRGRCINVAKSGSRTTVVWNPWEQLSAEMTDIGPEQYRHFVCVETVLGAQELFVLAPGQQHTLAAKISA
jgi:D-hexose-6-phosphate mutarotase